MNQAFRALIVVLAFTGIFLSGAITGGVLTFRYLRREQQRMEGMHRAEQQRQMQLIASLRQQVQAAQQRLANQAREPLRQRWQGGAGQRRLPSPDQFGPQLMQRFVNQIRPTPAQREQIRLLVDQTAESLRRLRRDTAYTTETTLEHLEDQISALLTPDQRDRFDAMVQRWRDAFQRYNQAQQARQAQQRLLEQKRWTPPAPAPGPASPPPASPAPAAAGGN